VIFTLPDSKTGKRDVYQMPDGGGPTLNLTHTPDVDECDAVWSPDGGAIAVASDAGTDDEAGRNYDIWVIDMKNPQRPRQVTVNGSWDDSPGWSPLGDAIYFRSNRGGAWGIWKVELKQ
jgi:TolB protein